MPFLQETITQQMIYSYSIWGFHRIRGTFLVIPIIRTIVFWGLHWGSLILGTTILGTVVVARTMLPKCWRRPQTRPLAAWTTGALRIPPQRQGGFRKVRIRIVLKVRILLRIIMVIIVFVVIVLILIIVIIASPQCNISRRLSSSPLFIVQGLERRG